MCGHFGGIAAHMFESDIDRIRELGIVSQLRGMDSTGIAVGYKRKKEKLYVDVHKEVDNASNFLYDDKITTALGYGKGAERPFIVMGHCRAATKGTVVADNAHPYDLDSIIGAHNGTVHGLKNQKANGTDSLAIFETIKEEGVQKAVDAAQDGAYALVWMDTNDQTINFLRNGERTLYILGYNGVIYWCSDYFMLKLMAARHGIVKPEINPLDIHEQLKVNLFNPFNKWEAIKRVPVERPKAYFNWKPKDAEKKGDCCDLPFKPDPPKGSGSILPQVPPPKKEEPAVQPNTLYKAFENKMMPISKAMDKLKEGCAFCAQSPKIFEGAHFFNKSEFLCDECLPNKEAVILCGNPQHFYRGHIVTFQGAASGAKH